MKRKKQFPWYVILGIIVAIGLLAANSSKDTNTSQSASPTGLMSTSLPATTASTAIKSTETLSSVDLLPTPESTPVAEQEKVIPSVSAESDEVPAALSTTPIESNGFDPTEDGKFRILSVAGGDISGDRASLVVVDVGFGDREYWAYTNEHGQLVRLVAERIVLQDDNNEPVNAEGRYYDDEAKVSGTEREDLDEGHVIADSLGGVSNAYNITPQDSVMNRSGDQAYMEKGIRDAGGCTDFEAIITYPNTKTQIPSHYKYTYILQGNVVEDSFDNVNPDVVNQALNEASPTATTESTPKADTAPTATPAPPMDEDITAIDANRNGQVTIAEAKAAGFKMPITRDHWLYKYMVDGDDDGKVGE